MELDNTEAVKWLRKAAEQNHAEAQTMLATCYYAGKGVKLDNTEAVKWLRKAAEQNHAGAQTILATCYYAGEGVAKDLPEAYAWINLAAQTDEGAAEQRDSLVKEMSPAQLAAGRKRAEELRAQIAARLKSGSK